MEAVKVQDIAVNDLPWKIEYNAERCTMCGSCVASCTFRAIKVEVQRKSVTVSQANQPEPIHSQLALPDRNFERDIYPDEREVVVIGNDLEVTRWKQ